MIWSLEHRTWSWAGFAQPGDEAARRKTLVLSATWWEGLEKDRLFSGVRLGRMRGNRNKLEHGKFQLSIRKIFPQECSSTEPGAQRGGGIYILGYSNLSYTARCNWLCPEQELDFQRAFPACQILWQAHFQCLQNAVLHKASRQVRALFVPPLKSSWFSLAIKLTDLQSGLKDTVKSKESSKLCVLQKQEQFPQCSCGSNPWKQI